MFMGLGSASNKTSSSSWKTEKCETFYWLKFLCLGYVCTRLQLHRLKRITPQRVLTYLKSIGLQWQRLLRRLSEAPAITRDKSLVRLALSKFFLIEYLVEWIQLFELEKIGTKFVFFSSCNVIISIQINGENLTMLNRTHWTNSWVSHTFQPQNYENI